MQRKLNRRQALTRLASAGVAALALRGAPAFTRTRSPNTKLSLAVVGCGGRGTENLQHVSGENIVALCDVDEARAADAFKAHPKARRFRDYRKMLDAMHSQIDAVVVSTPDHMHAPVSLLAMEHGKHVYCEKPLTWGIEEVRRMARTASEKRLATQMGTQGMAMDRSRQGIEVIRTGVLGKVTEMHVWTDRPAGWWPQGMDRPRAACPCAKVSSGTCGWAWPRPGPTTTATAPSCGAAGRTSAPGRSATWASTTPPCRSRPWTWARHPPRRSSRRPA